MPSAVAVCQTALLGKGEEIVGLATVGHLEHFRPGAPTGTMAACVGNISFQEVLGVIEAGEADEDLGAVLIDVGHIGSLRSIQRWRRRRRPRRRRAGPR